MTSDSNASPNGGPMIAVADLVKHYGQVEAVRGVTLGVKRGEVVVLIGPSGCGKSTILRCIHLLEEPTSGMIRVGSEQLTFGRGGRSLKGRRLALHWPRSPRSPGCRATPLNYPRREPIGRVRRLMRTIRRFRVPACTVSACRERPFPPSESHLAPVSHPRFR